MQEDWTPDDGIEDELSKRGEALKWCLITILTEGLNDRIEEEAQRFIKQWDTELKQQKPIRQIRSEFSKLSTFKSSVETLFLASDNETL